MFNRHLPAKTLVMSMLAASVRQIRLGGHRDALDQQQVRAGMVSISTPPRLPMHHLQQPPHKMRQQHRRRKKNKRIAATITTVAGDHNGDSDAADICSAIEKRDSFRARKAAGTKKRRRAEDPHMHYRFVPGTLDLLKQRGIVCPGQSIADLLHSDDGNNSNILYGTPQEWNDMRTTNNHEIQQRDDEHFDNNVARSTGSNSEQPGLVVFKRGGSGSTWFDSILSSHPDISFKHEAQSYFRPDDTPEIKTDVLVDYLTTPKFDTKFRGFSISPAKHGNDVDWIDLFRRTGAVLVVFVRTNVVKRRVGMIRKGMVQKLQPKCRGSGGGGHLKNVADDECHLGKTELTREDIDRLDYSCLLQTWDLLDVALSAGVPFQVVTFEGLQQSLSDTMRDVGLFAGWDELLTYDWGKDGMVGNKEGRDRSNQSTKVTPEELNTVLSNYEKVESVFETRDMKCYREMLRQRTANILPLCRVPGTNGVIVK